MSSDDIKALNVNEANGTSATEPQSWRVQSQYFPDAVELRSDKFYRRVEIDPKSKFSLIRVENRNGVDIYYIRHPLKVGAILDKDEFAGVYEDEETMEGKAPSTDLLASIESSLLRLDEAIVAQLKRETSAQKLADYMSGMIQKSIRGC